MISNKILSGSPRDKVLATPKQNKWKDPFYCAARGKRSFSKRPKKRAFVLPFDTNPPRNKRNHVDNSRGFSGFIRKVFRRKSF
jgi:hypothetical protein